MNAIWQYPISCTLFLHMSQIQSVPSWEGEKNGTGSPEPCSVNPDLVPKKDQEPPHTVTTTGRKQQHGSNLSRIKLCKENSRIWILNDEINVLKNAETRWPTSAVPTGSGWGGSEEENIGRLPRGAGNQVTDKRETHLATNSPVATRGQLRHTARAVYFSHVFDHKSRTY